MTGVLARLERELREHRLHMTLLDPANQSPADAGHIAAAVQDAGTDAIMVGGSTGVTPANLDETVLAIKKSATVPVILFPTNARTLSRHADAIYFMSMLNSEDPRFLIREQMKGARIVKKLGIEPIPMGYIIVAPGMKVGEVGKAHCVARDDFDTAVGYALAGQFLGMRLIYLEAGSGAPEPVPREMIAAVKKELSVPLIAGGGIRTREQARAAVDGGADIVVTGTIVEEAKDIGGKVRQIVSAVKAK